MGGHGAPVGGTTWRLAQAGSTAVHRLGIGAHSGVEHYGCCGARWPARTDEEGREVRANSRRRHATMDFAAAEHDEGSLHRRTSGRGGSTAGVATAVERVWVHAARGVLTRMATGDGRGSWRWRRCFTGSRQQATDADEQCALVVRQAATRRRRAWHGRTALRAAVQRGDRGACARERGKGRDDRLHGHNGGASGLERIREGETGDIGA